MEKNEPGHEEMEGPDPRYYVVHVKIWVPFRLHSVLYFLYFIRNGSKNSTLEGRIYYK